MANHQKTNGNDRHVAPDTVALPYDHSHPAHWTKLGTEEFTMDQGFKLVAIKLRGHVSNLYPEGYTQFAEPKLHVKSRVLPATDVVNIDIAFENKKQFMGEVKLASGLVEAGRLNKLFVREALFTHPENGDPLFRINTKADGAGSNGAVSAPLILVKVSKKPWHKISYDAAMDLTKGLPVIPCQMKPDDEAKPVIKPICKI